MSEIKTRSALKNLTRDFLQKEYTQNKKSIRQISKKTNYAFDTIRKYLKKYNISIRSNSESLMNHKVSKETKQKMRISRKVRIGRLAPNFKDGRTLKKYYCKEPGCNNEIIYDTWKCSQGRCESCSKKGKKNFQFIDGRKSKNYFCINCGTKITASSGFYGKGRCLSCASKGENNYFYIDGSSFEVYPLGWTKTFKEQIRKRDNCICQICSKTQLENGRRLDVHHIDYQKDNLDPKNLISLCQSCHMKTNWDRNHWQDYFNKKEYLCKKK